MTAQPFTSNPVKQFQRIFVLLLLLYPVLAPFSAAAVTEKTPPPKPSVAPVLPADQVQIDADEVTYDMRTNSVIASGNVVVKGRGMTLYSQKFQYFRDKRTGVAQGEVTLLQGKERLTGENLDYDFNTMKGRFVAAHFFANPFYGAGRTVRKVGRNHFIVENGYITTSDFDNPEYRITARRVDVYPGDKAVARHMWLKLGPVPIMYLPKYTQDLSSRQAAFTITPGYRKSWGAFVLTKWRYEMNPDLKGAVHLDYRDLKGFGWGVDSEYTTQKYGEGIIRTYYTDEQSRTKHIWQTEPGPIPSVQRYKIEWRHKWDINPETSAIWQYYRISDTNFLKDYFQREYDQNQNPSTYFVLNRIVPHGTMSLEVDKRVNPFTSAVDRLPQANYTLSNTQLGNSGFYLEDSSTFSYLQQKQPNPSSYSPHTARLDTNNQLSYPLKVGFLETRPWVGMRQTYYSQLLDKNNDGVRGIFSSGVDVSTKFYRIYDVNTNAFGLDIHRLRHVITPSVAYSYVHKPTLPISELVQYDSIDAQQRSHQMVFSLENKLQTKRKTADGLQSVDLVRLITSAPYRLKDDPGTHGFSDVTNDLEVRPYDWLLISFETTYNTKINKTTESNADLYLDDPKGRWHLQVEKRFQTGADNLVTTNLGYSINPKWQFWIYHRYDITNSHTQEEEFRVRRDLHAWYMDVAFDQTRDAGSQVWILFTLKAFPQIGVNASSSFSQHKPGSQTQ